MNGPTIVGALIVLAIVAAIVGRGIWNRRHRRGGCSCGCGDCPSRGLCHPDK
ncbi:FeoB-associated Cys-rich membrane protein [Bittarella massiliensis (ex Durand et al. 2017)]|uniref:FeoB-associated Cys-rich membrane protein n=1 Tax=Bittarella massiliensis (ex Durand et al. 2017) TaxID=1720313 RepID=A0AAW5KH81_9FIRM|nr:FeoB-associated Cys-rich membrane protein [Bittarella massiliensis (ex Durand et al. 2017)]MCQ4949580.1 FeoB-associated Cys-rich membrane protein [Bittarella massiliensis (ex Durand et al. 2017)]